MTWPDDSATIGGVTSGRVFRRVLDREPPVAVRAEGSTIWDADGRSYLDAAGGAIVVGIGHGRESVARVMAEQAGRLAYAHGTAFTSEPLEAYAAEVGPHLPMREPAIYPVSGGSEAMETALKMARTYHIARGQPDRWVVIARWGSYHGNTLGALDLSGRKPLRRPYEGWLGRFRHVSAAYPYRAADPDARALGTADAAAAELDAVLERAEPGSVAAFVAEPIVGATLGAVEPPPGYWPAIAEVCRRHGVLLVADEVMTGFGRTGHWFAMEPVRRPAGHPGGRQGRHLGLRAVRLRGRQRRGLRGDPGRRRVHPRLHLQPQPGRGGRGPRGPADPPGGAAGGGQCRQGQPPAGPAPRSAWATIPTSATSAAAASSPPSSWSPIAPPGPRSRGPSGSPSGCSPRPASAASCSTRAPAWPTARRATRCCWARRSSSRREELETVVDRLAQALEAAVAATVAAAV